MSWWYNFLLVGRWTRVSNFISRINTVHPTLKFTHQWSKTEINFLDLTLYKGERFNNTQILDIKCFSKPCDTFRYLSRDTSHPNACFSGMVKGEAIRYIRNSKFRDWIWEKIRFLQLKTINKRLQEIWSAQLSCRYFLQKTKYLVRGCSKNDKWNTFSLLHASLPSKK